MKWIKWKSLMATCIVCVLPILLGIALWNNLPDTMAIHFNVYNEPDNFASKGFVVFGIPLLMAAIQIFCCLVNDINSYKKGVRIKLERVVRWIIPLMSVVLHTAIIGFGLGWNMDMRRIAVFIVGVVFLVIGNYLPKLDYVKHYDIDTEKARKINRTLGYGTVIMGVLSLVTLFMPPIASVIWLFLLILYVVLCVIYAIKVEREK